MISLRSHSPSPRSVASSPIALRLPSPDTPQVANPRRVFSYDFRATCPFRPFSPLVERGQAGKCNGRTEVREHPSLIGRSSPTSAESSQRASWALSDMSVALVRSPARRVKTRRPRVGLKSEFAHTVEFSNNTRHRFAPRKGRSPAAQRPRSTPRGALAWGPGSGPLCASLRLPLAPRSRGAMETTLGHVAMPV